MSTVEHGGAPAGWLDFSANLNPLGTPDEVRQAIARVGFDDYASLETGATSARVAAEFEVAPERVLLTAGATEGLRLVIEETLAPGAEAAVVGPTYGEYERVVRLAGARARRVDAAPPRFEPPLERIVASPGGVVIVCDPNNPTGQRPDPRVLAALARAGMTVIADESFLPFARPRAASDDGIVRVRSWTKRLAIPGVRLGAVVAPSALIARLRDRQDPWTVGAHALAAARVAKWTLGDDERRRIEGWRDALGAGLTERGWDVMPSDAPFVLAHVGPQASRLVKELWSRRIAVRACASFGLPEYVRVAVRDSEQIGRLFTALDAAMHELRA